MGTKFNFKCQVCTDKNQSERLLALGLKKETADCRWTGVVKDSRGKDIPKNEQMWFLQLSESENCQTCGFSRTEFLPAWSLHRLMILAEMKGSAFLDLDVAYETTISVIAAKIRFGYFNKEYLEE